MKLSIGIVGLPNVGKSTLFKLLTKNDINVANYPFCTIDPNIGIVPVPDERLGKLMAMSKSKKVVSAIVEFYDIAGLVRGAAEGQGLGNKFLSHIREVDAILHVLRVFPAGDIIHVEDSIDAARDLEIIDAELALADLEVVERRLEKLSTEARSGDKLAKKNYEVALEVQRALQVGERVYRFAKEPLVREMRLLTARPEFFLLNGSGEYIPGALTETLRARGGNVIVADLGAAVEIPELIIAAYKTLGLISFFTTGEDETRAWTIPAASKAPIAAGAIHSDFQEKFIRAEVIGTGELLAAGSWGKAREQGKIRIEGKEYVVCDGDVMVIRHG